MHHGATYLGEALMGRFVADVKDRRVLAKSRAVIPIGRLASAYVSLCSYEAQSRSFTRTRRTVLSPYGFVDSARQRRSELISSADRVADGWRNERS